MDPVQGNADTGVGIMSIEGLNVSPIAKPIKDYHDPVATGGCAMYCIDMGGVTLVIAVVYGGTGARKGSPGLRERTISSQALRCSLKPCHKALNSLPETLMRSRRHSIPLVLSQLKMDGPMLEW